MGDVGSGYVGYVIAVLALAAARNGDVTVFVWLTLGGAFFVDATVTLIRRSFRREKIYHAHRTHAYQVLAQKWGSHLRVTVAVMLVNVVWLLPCAWLEITFPNFAAEISAGALLSVAALALACGAGRREDYRDARRTSSRSRS